MPLIIVRANYEKILHIVLKHDLWYQGTLNQVNHFESEHQKKVIHDIHYNSITRMTNTPK